MRDDTGGLDEDGGLPSTPGALRVLIALMGEDLADYDGSVRPPEELRLAVRAAPTPVLRAVLIDAAAELDRTRRGREEGEAALVQRGSQRGSRSLVRHGSALRP